MTIQFKSGKYLWMTRLLAWLQLNVDLNTTILPLRELCFRESHLVLLLYLTFLNKGSKIPTG